jgi:methylated-DNA-protein-cysteine methyltransferase-like protein
VINATDHAIAFTKLRLALVNRIMTAWERSQARFMKKTQNKNQRHRAGTKGGTKNGRGVATSPRRPAAGFDKVFERIYRLVLRIPRGRVMTYGQIARLLEERYSPRLVGWAMHATPHDERNIPWHRVLNSRGAISTGRVIIHEPDLQRLMLEAEGVVFDDQGHCDLRVYQWSPRQRAARARIKSIRESSSRKGQKKTKAPARKK